MSTKTVKRPAKTVETTRVAVTAKVNPALEIFRANLPMFYADIRGNVVADPDTFTSKAGKAFTKFRIAYTRLKGEEKHTMFIQVLCDDNGEGMGVAKGDYVRVAGSYYDDGVSPATDKYEATVFRTLFHTEDDPFEVLIAKV